MSHTIRKSITLRTIINQLARAYPDHFLQDRLEESYQPDHHPVKPAEALAVYLIAEMRDLYDATSTTQANLERIRESFDRSEQLLASVVRQLDRLIEEEA